MHSKKANQGILACSWRVTVYYNRDVAAEAETVVNTAQSRESQRKECSAPLPFPSPHGVGYSTLRVGLLPHLTFLQTLSQMPEDLASYVILNPVKLTRKLTILLEHPFFSCYLFPHPCCMIFKEGNYGSR